MTRAPQAAVAEAVAAARTPPEGQALRMLRQHRELTQGQLSEISGVSRAAISDFERGERGPSPGTLERLLEALELPERAWRDTVRHVEWIEWLSARRKQDGGGRVIERIAESACRDLERHVIDILSLVAPPGRREGPG